LAGTTGVMLPNDVGNDIMLIQPTCIILELHFTIASHTHHMDLSV